MPNLANFIFGLAKTGMILPEAYVIILVIKVMHIGSWDDSRRCCIKVPAESIYTTISSNINSILPGASGIFLKGKLFKFPFLQQKLSFISIKIVGLFLKMEVKFKKNQLSTLINCFIS